MDGSVAEEEKWEEEKWEKEAARQEAEKRTTAERRLEKNISSIADPRDGRKYRAVKIDGETWMAENLNYQTDSSWCYGDDTANCDKYGRLYAWRAARQACPPGWHLPAIREWGRLTSAVTRGDYVCVIVVVMGEELVGGARAGTRLKAKNGWRYDDDCPGADNYLCTDEYGFSALPGGYRKSGADYAAFLDDDDSTGQSTGIVKFREGNSAGYWWTSTDDGYTSDRAKYIEMKSFGMFDYTMRKTFGLSARCVLGESDLPTEEERRRKHEDEQRKKQEMFERWEKEERERQKKKWPRAKNVPAYFTDSRDGRKYRAVTIGGKTWMAENLNYQADSSRCYNDSDSYCEKYGRLYDWDAAMKVCPAGWHLPSISEWDRLGQAAGGIVKPDSTRGKHDRNWFISWHEAGLKLKAGSGWRDNVNGTDEYGFSALPGGYRFNYGGRFKNAGSYGYWWTATEFDAHNADFQEMKYAAGVGYGASDFNNKDHGRSVRCVKDATPRKGAAP
jgi:uncharacterized protein (TIGR02145 family)